MQESWVQFLGQKDPLEKGKAYPLQCSWASLVAQLVKNLPAMQETWVRSMGWEDPLEKGKATHHSILAWRIGILPITLFVVILIKWSGTLHLFYASRAILNLGDFSGKKMCQYSWSQPEFIILYLLPNLLVKVNPSDSGFLKPCIHLFWVRIGGMVAHYWVK